MLLGARLAIFGGGSQPEPVDSYDAEVEWLSTDGTAYIDTGCLAGQRSINTEFEISCSASVADFENLPSSSQNVFGGITVSRGGFNVYSQCWKQQAMMCIGNLCGGASDTVNFSPTEKSLSFPCDISFHSIKTLSSCHIDYSIADINASVDSSNISDKTFSNGGIYLFCRNLNGSANGFANNIRIKNFKLTDNAGGKSVDLIPVRKDGVGYMYDKVSGHLIGPSNGGSFIIGPDKPRITYLDYIEFQGDAAYIDTGYMCSSDSVPVMSADVGRINQNIFYPIHSLGVTDESMYAAQSTYGTYIQLSAWSDSVVRLGTQRVKGTPCPLRSSDGFSMVSPNSRCELKYDGEYFIQSVDGAEVSRIGLVAGDRIQRTNFLINRYIGTTSSTTGYTSYAFRLYGATLGDTTGLARKFKPALNEDGEAGLWDEISQTFYGNSASDGTILAGNVINS